MDDSATATAVTLSETDKGLPTRSWTRTVPMIVGLASGSSDLQVYTLQADLRLRGYNIGSSGVDDTATAKAVWQPNKATTSPPAA